MTGQHALALALVFVAGFAWHFGLRWLRARELAGLNDRRTREGESEAKRLEFGGNARAVAELREHFESLDRKMERVTQNLVREMKETVGSFESRLNQIETVQAGRSILPGQGHRR